MTLIVNNLRHIRDKGEVQDLGDWLEQRVPSSFLKSNNVI